MNKYKLYLLLPILFLASCGNKTTESGVKSSSASEIIIETGELIAVSIRSFPLPRYGPQWWEMKIIGLLEHGSIVNVGDSIIQLDPVDVQKYIIDRELRLETELATLEQMKVSQDNSINEIGTKIKNEEASFNLRKIDFEASRFETERIRKIKELEFKQAEIQLAKEMRKMELNKIIMRNNSKIQNIRVDQIKTEIANAYNILPQLTIRTMIPGVFQISTNYETNKLYNAGDMAYVGSNMANVPDLKWMKVNTFINENDFLKIRIGQKIAIRLDAMPKVVFEGEVAYIGKLCKKKDPKSRQKVFDVEVKVLESDERLKPGMTVSCEFL